MWEVVLFNGADGCASMAPMKRVGANMPPGVPLEKERVVAMILKTARRMRILKANWPCMA